MTPSAADPRRQRAEKSRGPPPDRRAPRPTPQERRYRAPAGEVISRHLSPRAQKPGPGARRSRTQSRGTPTSPHPRPTPTTDTKPDHIPAPTPILLGPIPTQATTVSRLPRPLAKPPRTQQPHQKLAPATIPKAPRRRTPDLQGTPSPHPTPTPKPTPNPTPGPLADSASPSNRANTTGPSPTKTLHTNRNEGNKNIAKLLIFIMKFSYYIQHIQTGTWAPAFRERPLLSRQPHAG